MNRKADIEISLKTIIGFIIVSILFLAFIGFFVKMWGMFVDKPNQATTNSFKNLVYEINNLETGNNRLVPFFIQEGLYLRVTCQNTLNDPELGDDICICKSPNDCAKRQAREFTEKKVIVKFQSGIDFIGYDSNQKVKNIKLIRSGTGKTVCIYEDVNLAGCVD
ncbi:MAG: hypothetical protein ABIJ08_06900 [Nanoarchaeota archaeon]